MTVIYAIMISIVIALFVLVFKREMQRHYFITPLLGWLVGLSFFLILPLTIFILNGGYHIPARYGVLGRWGDLDLSNPVYIYPFLVIWSSLLLTALALLAVLPKSHRPAKSVPCCAVSLPKLYQVILISSAIILTSWIITIVEMGGIDNYFLLHWYTRFDETVEQWGGIFVFFQHVMGALQIVLTAATSLLIDATLKKHTWRRYAVLIFALAMIVLNMIMTGNRIYIALLMLYVGISLLMHRRFRLILLMIVLLPVFASFFSAWSHVRGGLGDISTSVTNYRNSTTGESNHLMDTLVNVTEARNVMLLFHIINDYGPRYDFLYGATYSRAVTFFIPRSIWPDRTQGFTKTTAELYEPISHSSFSSTALGEMYANFGVFSVILLPLFTLAILWISNRTMARLSRHVLLSAALFMLFAWMARSVFAANFIEIILCVIIIWGLCFEKGLLYPTLYDQLLHSRLRRTRETRALDRHLFLR